MAKTNKNKYGPTAEQRARLRKSTSFGVLFVRRKPIEEVTNARGDWVKAPASGETYVLSQRRFGCSCEAKAHATRFRRIEGHKSFYVVVLAAKPNAYINQRTGKTNPLIGRKRTNRR